MWTSTNFEICKKQFDFSSSGQGKPTYTSIKVEGTEFFNMVERLEGSIEADQVFQTIICESCGIYACESGNWVALRQLENFVFFIPAFDRLCKEPARGEYQPPYHLRKNGAFWLTIKDFENLKNLVPALKSLDTIERLSHQEFISLFKWDTPQKMFGDFPDFIPLRMNRILMVSESNEQEIFAIIKQKLVELEGANNFNLRPIEDNDRIISIYLDDEDTTEWKVLCKSGDKYELILGQALVISEQ